MHLTVDVPQAGVRLTQRVTVVPPHHTAALLLQGLSDLNTAHLDSVLHDNYSQKGVRSVCLFVSTFALGVSGMRTSHRLRHKTSEEPDCGFLPLTPSPPCMHACYRCIILILMACVCVCVYVCVLACVHAHSCRCEYVCLGVVLLVQMGC